MDSHKIHNISFLFLFFLSLTLSALLSGCGIPELLTKPQPKTFRTTSTPVPDPRLNEIEAELQKTVQGRQDILTFLIYRVFIDQAQFSADGNLALLWLGLVDQETSEIIPGEAGLAIAKRVTGDNGNSHWKIVLQADADWVEQLNQVPKNMLSADLRARYLPDRQAEPKDHPVYRGYKLPWPAGRKVRVSGSIGHVFTYKTCPSTCLYAFDFADGTMFPVVAAKAGYVKYAVWRYPNGYSEAGNFLVIEDPTTNPTTYQVYYHLAQDSIPPALRVRGARVYQGQFIGNADDTGPSTAHHLHFHVHTNPNSYWGSSVDIVFDDVPINGGRPRTCTEARAFPNYGKECIPGNWLTSMNGDDSPPTGTLDAPKAGAKITAPEMRIRGHGEDDNAIESFQVLVTWDGNWHQLGATQTKNPFDFTVNICEAGIPVGPFMLALRIQDTAGRLAEGKPGYRLLENQYPCNPPTQTPAICNPTSDQVALYSDAGFSGHCQVYDPGDYATMDNLEIKPNDIESIKVGNQVMLRLFTEASFGGEEELFLSDDDNLDDNPIKANRVASFQVQQRPPLPEPPQLAAPHNAADLPPTDQDEITLTWKGKHVGEEYRAELNGPTGFYRVMEWTDALNWTVGKLPAGDYTLLVWARNPVGESQAMLNFSVIHADEPPVTHLLPLKAEMDSTAFILQWEVMDGADDLERFEIQFRDNNSEWQDWKRPLSAQMRQTLFMGEQGHHYEFRLRGVDHKGNQEAYPDQPEAITQVKETCQEDPFDATASGDDQWLDATPLDIGISQEHNICGIGDEDWVVFPAESGKSYRISVTPDNEVTAISIQLYDNNGYTLLGENKPTDFGQPVQLDWIAPNDGLYFLRLRPYDAGLAGDSARFSVRIEKLALVYTPTLFCSTLILPLIWLTIKAFYRLKTAQRKFI